MSIFHNAIEKMKTSSTNDSKMYIKHCWLPKTNCAKI